MAANSGGAASGVRAHTRYRDAVETVEWTAADGTAVVASPSFLEVDSVAACTIMLTRDDPSVAMRKEDVEEAVHASLCNEPVQIHTIRKFNNDRRVICVRFTSASAADALIHKKTLLIKDVVCTVSRYGETLLRIQLSHVPMTARIDEVIDVVKHIGTVKRVTRPLIHGFEDHLVHIALVPNSTVNLSEEQKMVNRSAIFGGRRTRVQYRCLDETAFCSVCNDVGHTNGPRCPLAGRCLICNRPGHMKRNCPDRHTHQRARGEIEFPEREEEDHALDPETRLQYPATRPETTKNTAPHAPPMNPSALASTGLPGLLPGVCNAWGQDISAISALVNHSAEQHPVHANEDGTETRRSRSPLDSSTRSIVSAERQLRLEKTIRGGQMRSENIREKMKEKKRRNKDRILACVNAPDHHSRDIPQTDGPTDSPAAASHISEDNTDEEELPDTPVAATHESAETDNVKFSFKAYEEWDIQEIIDNQQNFICCECGENGCPNVCMTCPIFPTTWCSKEHKCVSAKSQLAAFSMDVNDIPPCSDCGLMGMHTCNNHDSCKLIPKIGIR